MSINYYVIGSIHNYKNGQSKSMYNYMVDSVPNVVSMAWGGDQELSFLLHKNHEEIDAYLKSIDRSDAYPYLKLFLNLERDDIIAIKTWRLEPVKGSIPKIIVLAYARIIGMYSYDKSEHRHNISVDYFIKDVAFSFSYNYRKAIVPITELEEITEIFGPVLHGNPSPQSSPAKGRGSKIR